MAENLLLIALVFCCAGTVKGVTGIGLPTVSVAILSQVIPPHEAIAYVVFPILLTNFWQVLRSGAGLQTIRKFAVLISCLVVTLLITTSFTASVSTDQLMTMIGAVVILFAVLNIFKAPITLPDRFDRFGQVATGVSSGVLGGLTSLWAPPVVTYLLARRTDPDEFVQAAGMFLFLGGFPLLIGYWNAGLLNATTAPTSALMILPALLGFSLGEMIRKRLNPDLFRSIVLWLFLVMGVRMVFFL